jgi:hypothetical protein
VRRLVVIFDGLWNAAVSSAECCCVILWNARLVRRALPERTGLRSEPCSMRLRFTLS